MATKKKTTHVTKETKEYWNKVKELLDISGDYAAAIKLRANLLDSSTFFKVEHVLNDYYDGKMSNLEDAIICLAEKFFTKLEKFNIYCLTKGLPTVTKPDTLFSLLFNNDRRRFYRNSVEKGLKANMIVPLQIIEMNYRGRK